MKSIRQLLLLTVLLLGSSQNLLGQHDTSFTGMVERSDSVAIVDLDLIRKANAKMIERLYLLDIVNEQDSVIQMKDDYITEQNSIISDLQQRIVVSNKLNESVKSNLDKQKRLTKIIGGCAGCAVLGIIIGLLIN